MPGDKRIHIRIHPLAKPAWTDLLAKLPGTHDDKVLLIKQYMHSSWPEIKAKLAGGGMAVWNCDFAKDVEFLLASRVEGGARIVTVFEVRPRSHP